MHPFTESHLSDIDNILPFENNAPVNQNINVWYNRSGIFERCNAVSVR